MTILSRLAAVAILAIPFGRWLVWNEATKMAQYRSLSHDALLAVLQEQNKATLGTSYVGAAVLLALVFFLVLGLGVAMERLARFLRAS